MLRKLSILARDISPVAKIPVKTRVLFQVALRRVLELSESFFREANAGSFAPPYVIARALLETASLAFHVWKNTKEIIDTRDKQGLLAFDERTTRALLGARSEKWGYAEKFQAINVLTVIGTLAEVLTPNIRSIYDGLCEHAHPNFAGMMGAYQRVDEERHESIFIDAPTRENREGLALPMSAVAVGLRTIVFILEGYEALLGEFVSLCEEAIYEDGTWPAGVAYPRVA